MLSWAVAFFVIGMLAALVGFSGVAETAVSIAWTLAVLGIVVFVVLLVLDRQPPSP